MAQPKVYDVSTANVSLDAEIERLYYQANLNVEKEGRNLLAFGLRDGMSVLEVGSGPGFVTEWVSKLIPNGSITCVELDPVMIKYAEQHLERAAQCKYRFVEASINKTDLPDESFDFAFGRLVFEHIPDRVEALNEIKRLLKPGGRLVLTEGDFAFNLMTDPYFPEIQPVREKLRQYQTSLGGNTMIGRELWRILSKAGFKNIDLEIVATHSGDKGIEGFYPQINPQRALPLVDAGVITEEEYETLRAASDKLLASEDRFVIRLLLMACGEKP
ncbi:MAG: class I SAM-dependent methyltransferase [Blastocatellia bacterium]